MMEYKILSNINSPADLKKVPAEQIPLLCDEIRHFLVENVERTGGHLASNLGVTELTVALHRVFDSPDDHIIFDVGHQSYVHKILTERKDRFDTLRKPGGLSGFTLMRESEYDAFGAGHSSTSVSAALGYAEADKLANKQSYSIAVLGDGAYTGGMVHEALNNCKPDLRLIIILNENGMSISVNKGSFASYLSRVRTSKKYTNLKKSTKSFLARIPLLGRPLGSLLDAIKRGFKRLFLSSNYFEDLGLYYIGPIDGNDEKKVEEALRFAKEAGKCVVLHIKTVKGKGYEPAELSPDFFHSVYGKKSENKKFPQVFCEELIKRAEQDKKILAITAAMSMGTGLVSFEKAYPDRFFDVGIAEEHALTFSAGLAAGGYKPYVDIYSTFLQRGYDSIIHDICLQNLPVRIIIDRAGLAPSDGATHHGIFDVAFLSHIPNMTIFSPATYISLKEAIDFSLTHNGPVAIRYPNSNEVSSVDEVFSKTENFGVKINFAQENIPEHIFVTYGTIVKNVFGASSILKDRGVSSGIILLDCLKPYENIANAVKEYLSGAKRIIFVEEGIKYGGAGMLLKSELSDMGVDLEGRYFISAIDDNFASPTEVVDIYDYVGLSPEKLAEKMQL